MTMKQYKLQTLTQSLKPLTFAVLAGVGFSILPVLASSKLSSEQLIAQKPKTVELTLVSYAVTQAAYSKIIPQFAAKWKKEHNQEVVFRQSFGGSGSQTRAVIDGLEADVVALALALDVEKIEKAGLIKPGWEKEAPNNAIVTRSVAAIVTRQGNPKKINTWSDLVKPGVQVITANPKTSGGARWNFLALWGSVTQTGGNEQKARQFVTQVYKNVPVLPKDAREASDVFFKQGQGDVLINYENEVILAKQKGEGNFSYTIPAVNVSIDAPVAVVDKNVDKHKTRPVAEAFVKFLYTPEAQREFAKVGFRPVNTTVSKEVSSKFPKVNKLSTVQTFGGWDTIQKKFFNDGTIFDQIQSTSR
ncbi:sulfate ABC transporter substrate-binding protein [Aphanothece hegewaldii CCALA 016]|uniref:Sulfate ABC transporter substrate-binding protein n=2 Tax=Aphanothece TaxID=1121 RepID=A0A2T1LUP0_9CHRO|nr:sulfate ABC transporter substrate-binding protein [Aphanothece hegewaldii CCALA 016]